MNIETKRLLITEFHPEGSQSETRRPDGEAAAARGI